MTKASDDQFPNLVELAMAAYRHVRALWIEEHGSERLKLAAKHGLLDKSDNVYRGERRDREKKGWKLENEMPLGFHISKIHNPSLAALQALDLELATDKDVTLVYVEWKEDVAASGANWGKKSHIRHGREALSSRLVGWPVYRWI
jgi:hypothetical protein